jgi:23S rRNA (guanosine2251-2'-O)-methyltransferase
MVIVLDNIRSAFNVGSVMRSCDATACSLITVGYTPRPLGETRMLIKKTAINAEEVVKWEHFDHPTEVFEAFPDKIHIGIELFDDAENVYDFLERCGGELNYNLDDIFLWVGNEIHGISPEYQNRFSHTVFLPMEGIKESLNVGSTTTATIYLFKTLETKKIVKKI